MGRLINIVLSFLLFFAMSCGNTSTLDNERVGTSTSDLLASNGLMYPIDTMSSWTDGNYGACGSDEYAPDRCHIGNDILVSNDSVATVYPIKAGTVVIKSVTQDATCSSNWGYDYGRSNTCNMALAVRHYDASGQPFIMVYGHLRDDSNIKVGTKLVEREPIGVIGRYMYVGGGRISRDHLHWGIMSNDGAPSVRGRAPCLLPQQAGPTLPDGCSSYGFVPPGTFITQHFPAGPPFSHHDHPVICENQPTPDSSWYYTCDERSDFVEGEQAWVLLRLHDIGVNHQFKVKAYKNEAFQWDWTTGLNTVGSGGWQYSHFWPELTYAILGEWRFDLFLIPQGGPEVYVDTARFTVHPTGWVDPGTFGGGGESDLYGYGYDYDGNAYTCPGPIIGGQDTNWVYTCGIPRKTFEQGETVYSLVRLDNVMSDFRFSFSVYKNGVYQWQDTGGWNDVGQWGWGWTHYPILMQDAQPGNWEFHISVDEGYGFELIETLDFVVTPKSIPYEYSGDLTTCHGPIVGGSETGWIYTCQNPASTFSSGQSVSALVRIDNVLANHRWKEEVYINGVYQWQDIGGWNDVGQWGWGWAYFMPSTSSVWPGNWEYRIYLDSGNGFEYIDSAYFTVN